MFDSKKAEEEFMEEKCKFALLLLVNYSMAY